MVEEVIFNSPNATITKISAEIRGLSFLISKISEVDIVDERPKALRWAKNGAIAAGAALTLGLLLGAMGARLGAIPGLVLLIGLVALVLGGGTLVMYSLNPALGTGLVITTSDGSSDIIKGLTREELQCMKVAINQALAMR
jgi:Family of unknown function (DUF6232)